MLKASSVRMKGLEPPRRETPDPKSGAATNYATSAGASFLKRCKGREYFLLSKYFGKNISIFNRFYFDCR